MFSLNQKIRSCINSPGTDMHACAEYNNCLARLTNWVGKSAQSSELIRQSQYVTISVKTHVVHTSIHVEKNKF